MSTCQVTKQAFSNFSASGGDSPFDFAVAVRAELDALRLASVGFLSGAAASGATGSIADAAGLTKVVPVAGAALGDFVLGSIDVDNKGVLINGYVQAADTCELRLQNESGTAFSETVVARALVIPWATAHRLGLKAQLLAQDLASISDGDFISTDVTCTGAKVGDFALAAITLDAQDCTITADVTAADTVTVHIQNESTGARDFSSMDFRVLVIPAAAPGLATFGLGSAAFDVVSQLNAVGSDVVVPVAGATLGDFAIHSCGVDTVDQTLTASVSANGVAKVRVQNESGGTVNLASTTYRVLVIPQAVAASLSAPSFQIAPNS